MRIVFKVLFVALCLLPSVGEAAYLCSYKNFVYKPMCRCRKGLWQSQVTYTRKMPIFTKKKWMLKKIRQHAKKICRQVKGRVVGWADRVVYWKIKRKGIHRWGTMKLAFGCNWQDYKAKSYSNGPWTEKKTAFGDFQSGHVSPSNKNHPGVIKKHRNYAIPKAKAQALQRLRAFKSRYSGSQLTNVKVVLEGCGWRSYKARFNSVYLKMSCRAKATGTLKFRTRRVVYRCQK